MVKIIFLPNLFPNVSSSSFTCNTSVPFVTRISGTSLVTVKEIII